MPRAQVLQAFLDRIAFHSRRQPTRLAIRKVYLIAAHPPPLVMRFMQVVIQTGASADCPDATDSEPTDFESAAAAQSAVRFQRPVADDRAGGNRTMSTFYLMPPRPVF